MNIRDYADEFKKIHISPVRVYVEADLLLMKVE